MTPVILLKWKRKWTLLLLVSTLIGLAGCGKGEDQGKEVSKGEKEEVELSPIEQASKEISSAPTVAAYNKRASLYLEKEDVEAAFEDVKSAIAIDSGNAEPWITGAKILRRNLQVPLSLEYAKRAEELGAVKEDLFMLMAEEYLILMQYQEAIDYCNKALKINNYSPEAYYYKGLVYEETKDYKRAISSYQTALEQNNYYPDAYNNLIKLFTAQNDFTMANQYVESGLRFLPEDVFIHYNYGILVEKQGLLDSALIIFQEAESLDTTFDLLKYKIANVSAALNKQDNAAMYYEKVLKLNPTFELVYSEYGQILLEKGDIEKAREILRQGLIRFPDSQAIKKLYDRTK